MIDESYIRESLAGALLLAQEIESEMSVDIPGIGAIVMNKSFVTILDSFGNMKTLTADNLEGRIQEIINRGTSTYDN